MSTNQVKIGPDFQRLYQRYGDPSAELHKSYDSWIADMASRDGSRLEPFAYDESRYPEQNIYIPKVEAATQYPYLPDNLYYLGFRTLVLGRSVGHLALNRLLNQFKDQPASAEDPVLLPERLIDNQKQGKNTLIVTSHIKFEEMGYTKAIRHLSKQDRKYIAKNGTLLNKLMSRQKYKGKTLVERFKPLGNVYFSSPKSKSSILHNVPAGAADLTNALFTKALKSDLEIGGLELDAALTGSEVKPKYNQNGQLSHYAIPEINQASAKLIKGFDEALTMTLVGPPLSHSWQMQIGELLDVKELLKSRTPEEVTDIIYFDIVKALEKFTKKDVQYTKVATKIGKAAAASS